MNVSSSQKIEIDFPPEMIVSSLPMRRRLSLIKLIFTSILSREIEESREKNWRTMTISGLTGKKMKNGGRRYGKAE